MTQGLMSESPYVTSLSPGFSPVDMNIIPCMCIQIYLLFFLFYEIIIRVPSVLPDEVDLD